MASKTGKKTASRKSPNNQKSRAASSNAVSRPIDNIWHAVKEWWWGHVTIDVDQARVIERIEEESDATGRYIFMICMSAGIAILGMILSSPAVVIGAMLLSPLMGPILGAGFGLSIGDGNWVRTCGKALILGSIVAVIFCALIVYLSPLQTVTPEIASRTRPNLFDLLVALFSGLAGSYAMVRGREGTIVGVAIATALMPPLAAIGFGLATANWTVFGGAMLLYVTNLVTIALTAAIMARLYGFHSSLSAGQSMLQNIGMIVAFLLLAVPLAYSLRQIAWEANASRVIKAEVEGQFGGRSRVSNLDISWQGSPIKVNASVLTPKFESEAASLSSDALTKELGRPIEVTIDQFKVGTSEGEVDAAELAAAKLQEQAVASDRKVAQLSEAMALIAGVESSDILIDRTNQRAVVEAKMLPGASLATYYTLEKRVRKLDPDWALSIKPPALPLPEIAMTDGKADTKSAADVELLIWAAKAVDAPVGVNGSAEDVEMVLNSLQEQGIDAKQVETLPRRSGFVSADWLAPDEALPAP